MNRRLLIVLVSAVAVLAIGLVCIAAYVFLILPGQQAAGDKATAAAAVAAAQSATEFYSPKKFVTNLADKDRVRYVDVSVSLGTKDAAAKTELEKMEPQIRDAIISQIRKMTAQELSGAEGKERMAGAIQAGLEEIPGVSSFVLKVYVTDMVIQ